MKFSKKSMMALSLLGLCFGGAAARADALPNGKVAELALHRIERLVILKKIDASYQTNFRSQTVQALTPQAATDPSFKVNTTQYPGADGSHKSLDIMMDATGKEIQHVENPGADATGVPVWTNQDAVTLAENSLHWLEDQGPVVAELTPYLNTMTSLTIYPGKTQAGADVATVDIQINGNQTTLRVTMNLDGTFGSYALVSQ